MFSKPQQPQSPAPATGNGAAPASETPTLTQPNVKKSASLIAADLKIEGSITGGSELQVDGQITGDVRVDRVSIGEGGLVEGGVFAEAVEVKGKVSGSITAKQVRLHGAAHVEGDITHEQLAIETGAFFQGRSLRLQRSAAQPKITPPKQPDLAAPAFEKLEVGETRATPPN